MDVPTKLDQLIAEGQVTPAREKKEKRPAPVGVSEPVSDLVAEQRR